MPTLRARHMITESDALARALDDAARFWPDIKDQRTELLRRLLEKGAEAIQSEETKRIEAREKAITSISGSLTDLWPENWREEFRAGWPE